jgi:hypothetical protein
LSYADLGDLVEGKIAEFATRPLVDAWAACASIWARLYVLAGPSYERWPEVASDVSSIFFSAMRRSAGIGTNLALQIPGTISGFHVEDDGSDEWSYMVDLIGVLTPAVEGLSAVECLDATLRMYMDSMLNDRARVYADQAGRPISVAEVDGRMMNDPEWRRVLSFVGSLLLASININPTRNGTTLFAGDLQNVSLAMRSALRRCRRVSIQVINRA